MLIKWIKKDFKLDIFYEDPGIDTTKTASDPGRGRKRFLPSSNLQGVPLIRVFNLDELNVQGDPGRDGVFDFVPELTIYPRTGRIMFPVLEPFGSHLSRQITEQTEKDIYVYPQLYDSTVIQAREIAEKNRFSIRGEYRTSISSEISLGAFNIPPGSVTVKAGGTILRENVDYQIDYNIGRVKILNDAYLSSGIPITVSFEDNTLFGFQTKTLLGLRADYKFSENFNIGATFLKLFERPFTPKVNIGDDPINNNIYGFDINYSGDAPWLTRMVDKIPFIDTKAPSSVTLAAEAAVLKPGHSRAINENMGEDQGGVVYLDDFEGSTSSIDLRQPTNAWVLASVPQDDPNNLNPLFPEADLINDIRYGANRALLNWFRIDPQFTSRQSPNFTNETSPYTSLVAQTEIFPNRQVTPDQFNNILPFDLVFYPDERGPYNFDQPQGYPGISAGLDNNGKLNAPETRWGGIMRSLTINNFEQSNVEFIEFWLLSPFLEAGPTSIENRQGNLYIDLGNISEDILRDSRRFFENGLPGPNNPDRRTENSIWAKVPLAQQVINAFDADPVAREQQDVGLDGFDNEGEREHFKTWLDNVQASITNDEIRTRIQNDPANDDFVGFLDPSFEADENLQVRYRNFNNTQGNSQPSTGQFLNSSTNIPDAEDIDNDYTLNETESYFRYTIPIQADGTDGSMKRDVTNSSNINIKQFITDERRVENGRIWYRFSIPLNDPNIRTSVGGIQDLRSVRFIRMFLKDFKEPVTLRFGQFELVRNQWRVYRQDLSKDVVSDQNTTIDINAVNIEENSSRCPFNYILPPGIAREPSIGALPRFKTSKPYPFKSKTW
ncbi:MAG: cell surface protein SprA [Saprospiraceae bacterium]|nr:cell surface protein SprA [Saprospiraceae bacterium]